jgi:flagellar hook assembly protein FlgD
VCTLSQIADWKVEIRNDLGVIVRTLSGRGQSVAAEWNGRDQSGEPLADGRYVYVLSASNGTGTARNAEVGVRVDNGAPPVQNVHASPSLVSPNGDGVGDSTRVLFTVSEWCRARVSLFDATGALVRRISAWAAAPAGVNAVKWDGTIVVGGDRVPAPGGAYRVRVEAMDAAGNTGTGAGSLLVDSTLGFVRAAPLYLSPNGDSVQDSSRLSFKLATGAKVTVSLVSGPDVLRKWVLGDLQKGSHSTAWDGADGSGDTVAGGRYTFVTTAVSDVGTVTVRVPVHVDLSRPRPTTTVSAATARAGRAFVLRYTVSDRYSPSVRVRIIVTGASGATVKSALVGWVASGRARNWSYTPATRGKYTIAVTATDRAGNRQAARAEVALTVR